MGLVNSKMQLIKRERNIMKKIILIGICLLFAASFSACTDAQRGKIGALGDNAKVECWSGGQLIYSGVSSGKISSESNSDGYNFVDRTTGKYMEVSGNCVITYAPD